jgi:hypothetical protein
VIGASGDSRIEIVAGASGSIQLITQGATWNTQTVQASMSTVAGAITAGGGDVVLDSSGIKIIAEGALQDNNAYKFTDGTDVIGGYYAYFSDGDDLNFGLVSTNVGSTGRTFNYMTISAVGAYARTSLVADSGAVSDTVRVDVIQASGTNQIVLNVDGVDADTIIKGNTADVFKVDAGLDRIEIGADHYFPTRSSSNPNGFWNEANQDMDFTFEGSTAAINLISDAGLDAIGIGGAAESGYKLKVTGNQRITGNLKAAAIENDTGLSHGTWTPTLFNTTNLSGSTAYQGQYMRVGNTVTASTWVDADPTATGACLLGMSLPVASDFTSQIQAIGFGSSYVTAGAIELMNVSADAANNRLQIEWIAANTANHGCLLTFTYQVL